MRLLLLVVLASFAARSAWALKKPTTRAELDEVAAIDALIKAERTLEAARQLEIRKLQAKLDADSSDHGNIERLKPDPAVVDRDRKALDALNSRYDGERAANMNPIIARVIALYDVKPTGTSGMIVGGPFLRQSPAWSPTYAPIVSQRVVENPSGDEKFIKLKAPSGTYAAITWADGTVQVNEKALEFGAGYLGAILYHECVHFEQDTTWGRGDKMSAAMREMQAHSADSGPLSKDVFGLTDAEVKAVHAAFMGQMESFRKNGVSGATMGSEQFAPDALGDAGEGAKVAADDGFWGSAAQEGAVADSVAAMNREHADIQEDIRRSAAERDRILADMAERKERNVYEYVLAALGLACSDPGAFHAQIDHGRSVSVEIDSDRLRTYFAEDMSRDGSYSWGPRPNACQEALMHELLAARGSVETATILQWAAQYRREHPTLLQKFTASIADFLSSFQGTDGGAGDGNDERGGRGSARGPGPVSDGGEAFRRGMEAQNAELKKYDPIIHKVFFGDGNPNWDGARRR